MWNNWLRPPLIRGSGPMPNFDPGYSGPLPIKRTREESYLPDASRPPMPEVSENKLQEGSSYTKEALKLVAENTKLTEHVESLEKELTKCKERLAASADDFDKKLRAERKRFNGDRESYVRTLESLTEEISFLKASMDDMKSKSSQTTPEVSSANMQSPKDRNVPSAAEYFRKIDELQDQLVAVKREKEHLKRQQESQQRDNQNIQSKLDQLVAKEKQIAGENSWLSGKIEMVKRQLEIERARAADLTAECNQARDMIERMKIDNQSKYSALKNERDHLAKKCKELEMEIENGRKRFEEITKSLVATQTNLSAAHNGNDALVKRWRKAKKLNDHFTRALPQLIQSIKEVKTKNDALKSDATNTVASTIEKINEIGASALTIAGLGDTLDGKISELRDEVAKGKHEIEFLQGQLCRQAEREEKRAGEMEDQLRKVGDDLKTMERLTQGIKDELEGKTEELDKAIEERKEAVEKLNTMERENKNLEAELKKKIEELLAETTPQHEKCKSDLAASRKEIRELKRTMHAVQNRCVLLDQAKCRQLEIEKELRFNVAELEKQLETIKSAKDRVSRMYEGALKVASDQKAKIDTIVSALEENLQIQTREILVHFMRDFESTLCNMHMAALRGGER